MPTKRPVLPAGEKYTHGQSYVRHHRGWSALGFAYIWLTVGCGFYYLSIVASHAMTDYWWKNYNVSGVQTFVAQVFHNHLVSSASSVQPTAIGSALPVFFGARSTVIAQSAAYARRLLLSNHSTTLLDVITAIRRAGFDAAAGYFTPLCWVDFNQTMELALSAARQRRCQTVFHANAAVYLEAIMRNVAEADYAASTYGPSFAATIFYYANSQHWLASVWATPYLSVADEAAYWRASGLTTWQSQLQNLFQCGISETISVVSALNLRQAVTISQVPYVMRNFGLWTTVQSFSGTWNIVTQAKNWGATLVRTGPGFLELQWDNAAATVVINATRSGLGAYGTIDLIAVAVPASLGRFYETFQTALYAAVVTGDAAADAFLSLSTIPLTPTPTAWLTANATFYTGNPMCLATIPAPFVMDSFGYDDACTTQDALTITPRQSSIVFAVAAAGVSSESIADVCGINAQVTECEALLHAALRVYTAVPSLTNVVTALRTAAAIDVADISMVQLVLVGDSTPTMLVQPMITTSDPWVLYGWITLFDWVAGSREVVQMLGDVASVTIMSREYATTPLSASAAEVPSSACQYVGYIIYYVSGALTAVVAVMSAFGAMIRGNVLGRNLFQMNRVVGPVWIGRPFLFLRAMSAIMLLSTASIELVYENGLTRFVESPRTVIESAVVAGEATWLTYVFNDVLVPLTAEYTRIYAPLSSVASWLILFAWDSASPFRVSATLAASCTNVQLGTQLRCTGGSLVIGSFARLAASVVVNALCTLGTYIIVRFVYRRAAKETVPFEPHLSIAAPSHAFLAKSALDVGFMDDVCCIMSGMIPLHKTMLFDTKLWVSLGHVTSQRSGYLLTGTSFRYHEPPHPDLCRARPSSKNVIGHIVMGWQNSIRLRALLGCGYLVSTLLGNYTYLVLTGAKMANDFWWDGFNSTGHQTFVSNWFNSQLLLVTSSNGSIAIDDPVFADGSQAYSSANTQVSTAAFYTDFLQEDANAVANVIAGLRKMDGCAVPEIFTAYCWVDLSRQWEVAATDARQARCAATQRANGAVYMEALLRNVDLDGFTRCWGSALSTAVLNALGETNVGSKWWPGIVAINQALSVSEEVDHWKANGLRRYETQWQNFKHLGVIETFAIQNAFGYNYPLTLKSSNASYALTTQTTLQLYWGWSSDLWAVRANTSGIGGLSLVRGSSNYAYINTSTSLVHAANGTYITPMQAPFYFVQELIGPFGTIDARRVAVPPSLRALTGSLKGHFNGLKVDNVLMQKAINAVANPGSFFILPAAWANAYGYYMGTVLCDLGTLSSSVQPCFSAPGSCTSNSLEQLQSSTTEVLQALILTGIGHEPTTNATLAAICTHESQSPQQCETMLAQGLNILHTFATKSSMSEFYAQGQLVQATIHAEVRIEMIQAMVVGNESVFSRRPYFDAADPHLDLFAWLYLFSWASGSREVITFTGDTGSLTTMSAESMALLTAANALELPTSLSTYIRSAIQYITILLVLVALMVLGYIIGNKGYIEGLNMMEINRVAGIVWVGRPFLALRGMTAICLLATARLDLVRTGELYYLESAATVWYTTVLASGEMGWLVYIINDVFSVWTAEYTMGYAVKSGIVAWGASGLWSLVSPVTHAVTVDRSCSLDAVDYQAVCTAGVLAIGSFERLCGLVGAAFGSALVCYLVERRLNPELAGAPAHSDSLLLSSPGRYMFEKEHWEGHGVYYMDKASGVINGVLSFEYRHQLYLFDIKMWRKYTIDRSKFPTFNNESSIHAIPLISTKVRRLISRRSRLSNVADSDPLGSNAFAETAPHATLVASKQATRLELVWELLGVVYVVASLTLSFAALDVFSTHMATNVLVADFATTVGVVVQTFNNALATAASVPKLDLLSGSLAISPQIHLGVDPAYPRMLMYSKLTTPPVAITGLRNLAVGQVVKMVTLYCWADHGRQWEMAYTAARQRRCLANDADNAAVYLESVLRNIPLTTWIANTGGKFEQCVGKPIRTSGPAGAAWYSSLLNHTWSTVGEEVRVWEERQLHHFTLQYGSGFGMGLVESLIVENALGVQSTLLLKSIPLVNRWVFRTTCVFNDLIYNDFYAIRKNESLIRSSPNYFGLSDPTQIEAYDVGLPLNAVDQTIHDQLGALGNIDAKWLAPPAALVTAVMEFKETLLAQMVAQASIEAAVGAIGVVPLTPTPPQWADKSLRFFGGNPMCAYGSPLPFVQTAFAFDDVCSAQLPLTIEWNAFNSLFAWSVVGANAGSSACTLCPSNEQHDCASVVSATAAAHISLGLSDHLAVPAIEHMELALFQIVLNQSQISLQQQLLLEPAWAIYGWAMVYDWVLNQREVLSVQGDIRQFNLISAKYAPTPYDASPPPGGLGPYMLRLGSIITYTLAAVAAIALLLWLPTRPTGSRWFYFWPVAGSVWMSRNLMAVRGFMAVTCLASAPLRVVTSTVLQRLDTGPRSPFLSCILAGESLWLGYFLHDILLPLTYVTIRETAPYSSFLAWVVVVILDRSAPPLLSATLDRQCTSINMDYMITCASGALTLGSWHRALTIGTIHIASVALCVLWAVLRHRHRAGAEPHMLLPLSAIAPVVHLWEPAAEVMELNDVASWVAGMLHVSYGGSNYMFDFKLWRLVALEDHGMVRANGKSEFRRSSKLAVDMPSRRLIQQTQQDAQRRQGSVWAYACTRPLLFLVGLMYLGFTIFGNVLYINVLQASMANDFGWASFNTSGTHVFLANLFNKRLLITTQDSVSLDSPALSDLSQSYAGSTALVNWYPTVAQRQLFDTSAALAAAVQGLRTMDPAYMPWMLTPYCWLDVGKQWEMASTATRQTRCIKMAINGAVYLETSLRNFHDGAAWSAAWGDSFQVGIAAYLETTIAGATWLQTVFTTDTTIAAEVAYWQAHGIASYELQWQNFKTTGFSDEMVITTALGLNYQLPLMASASAFHLDRQTSMRMYWAFASDLWAVAANSTRIGGRSLLRGAPNFAFANSTSTQLLFDNYTLVAPLMAGLVALEAATGPFNANDMVYVPCPTILRSAYGELVAALANLTVIDRAAQDSFLALPVKSYIGQVPGDLLFDPTAKIVGGNVMCGDDLPAASPTSALAALFGSDSMCFWWHFEYLRPSATGLLLAVVGFDAAHKLVPATDFAGFCRLDVYAETHCSEIYEASYNYSLKYSGAFDELRKQASELEAHIYNLNVSLVQYITRNGSAPELYARNIFDPRDRAWPLFGWGYLYEWVIGQREVVSIRGDAGTLTAISTHMNLLSMPLSTHDIPNRLSYVCQQSAIYLTILFIGITGVIILYVVAARGVVEGANLFELNRIVGHVWVGRTLVIVRSLTALWLLNTSTLALQVNGAATYFTLPPLAWYKTLLAASELTWLNYILNDLLSCATRQITISYAWKSTLCTWFFTVLWTVQSPQQYQARIDRTCTHINMDGGLLCTSAYIEIGSLTRVVWDLVIVVCSVVVMASFEGWRRSHELPLEVPTLLLSSSSLYMLDFDDWSDGGNYYLDQASGVLAGLVTLYWGNDLYVFDIKSWRLYVSPISTKLLRRQLQRTIPITKLR
ncbi:hypothetical protein ACHHYP_05092 [Achlya hypogyna]|uniref:Uncharacterized protein n=1 Tax=Achlya hypogyna TaxID=1202772 RepID=A0A1V9YZ91_ACHHY|nr:hypothetical protein ACHHYP_05092 [Achlya hypogyna]